MNRGNLKVYEITFKDIVNNYKYNMEHSSAPPSSRGSSNSRSTRTDSGKTGGRKSTNTERGKSGSRKTTATKTITVECTTETAVDQFELETQRQVKKRELKTKQYDYYIKSVYGSPAEKEEVR